MTTRVVIEGPDGAGKSTLIRRLVEHTGLPVKPRAADSLQGPVVDILQYIEDDLLHHGHEPGIFDRHPLISEMVYGPMIRGHMCFGDHPTDVIWLMDRISLFYSYEPVLIYCLPPWWAVRDNVLNIDVDQMPGVKENIRPIYELYLAQYARDASRARVHRWDYTSPDNYFTILRDVQLFTELPHE